MSTVNLLKRLRRKFVALNMAMVALVVVAALTGVGVLSYQEDVRNVYDKLENVVGHQEKVHFEGALERGGEGDGQANAAVEGAPADAAAEIEGAATKGEDRPAPPTIGGKANGEAVIPVAVCTLDQDGTPTVVSDSTTATIDEAVLEEAAAQVAVAEDGAGSLDEQGLFYVRRTVGDTVVVAFADEGSASGWRSLIAPLVGIGVGAIAAFFAIALFFARWALRPVEEAWTKQRQFVADASHELKTPLTVILANGAILREHPERTVESQMQWVESTQHEARQMQELVGDMLSLARLDADNAPPVREPVDLSDLAEREVLEFESVAFERTVALDSEIAEDVQVKGDAKRLQRLVSALVDNACKYANSGGRVRVTLAAVGRQAELAVHNTGSPIPAEDLPHVFDRFFRADKARTKEVGGFGLGLAIAREIAEEAGGSIAAENAKDGVTFRVRLPLG